MPNVGDHVALYISIRNGDLSSQGACRSRSSRVMHVCLCGSVRNLSAEVVFDLLSLGAENRNCGCLKVEYRTDGYGIRETPALWMDVLDPYVRGCAIGLPIWARWDDIEICSIPLFHYSDVPKERLISLAQVTEILEDHGYEPNNKSGG